MPYKKLHGFIHPAIIITIVFVVVIGLLITKTVFLSPNKDNPPQSLLTDNNKQEISPKTYKNNEYNFTFNYSADTIEEIADNNKTIITLGKDHAYGKTEDQITLIPLSSNVKSPRDWFEANVDQNEYRSVLDSEKDKEYSPHIKDCIPGWNAPRAVSGELKKYDVSTFDDYLFYDFRKPFILVVQNGGGICNTLEDNLIATPLLTIKALN